MLTWAVVVVLAVGVYGQRAVGAVVVDSDRIAPSLQRVVAMVPLALIVAVVSLQTFTAGQRYELDARAAGVAVAALCAWRRLPILVSVLAAATTTATIRALT